MISMSLNAAGSDAMRAQLEKLKKKASKEQLRKALKAGGEVLKKAIEERTPVRHDSPSGDALQPGQLKGDIHVTLGEDDHGTPTANVGPGPDTAKVMGWLEYGHALVVADHDSFHTTNAKGQKVRFVAAQPIMRPAWDASSEDAAKAMFDELKKDEA